MILVFLYIDKPVASLQFDMLSTGTVKLVAGMTKQVATARIAGKPGWTRVIVYGLNQDVFSGKFAEIDAEIKGIDNVVGADANAAQVLPLKVNTLSQPKNVQVKKK